MGTVTLRPPPARVQEAVARLRAGTVGNLARALAGNRKALVGSAMLAFFAFCALFPGVLAADDPNAEIYARGAAPSAAHLLGTTSYGQDVFSQLIWGTRQSLVIAVVVGGLATVLSVAIGVTAAYLGGIADDVLSLFTDVFLVIPAFPLIVVIAAGSAARPASRTSSRCPSTASSPSLRSCA